jgi:hypothetical protein
MHLVSGEDNGIPDLGDNTEIIFCPDSASGPIHANEITPPFTERMNLINSIVDLH